MYVCIYVGSTVIVDYKNRHENILRLIIAGMRE